MEELPTPRAKTPRPARPKSPPSTAGSVDASPAQGATPSTPRAGQRTPPAAPGTPKATQARPAPAKPKPAPPTSADQPRSPRRDPEAAAREPKQPTGGDVRPAKKTSPATTTAHREAATRAVPKPGPPKKVARPAGEAPPEPQSAAPPEPGSAPRSEPGSVPGAAPSHQPLRVLEQLEIDLPAGAVRGPRAAPPTPTRRREAEPEPAAPVAITALDPAATAPMAPAAEPARPQPIPKLAPESQPAGTELAWARLKQPGWGRLISPRQAPEQAARAAVAASGPAARDWVSRTRTRYPRATPDGLARLAAREFGRQVVWTSGPRVAGERAQLVLTIAAAYGVDPVDPRRAPELLELLRVPRVEPSRSALRELTRSVTGLAARMAAARLVPFGGTVAGSVQRQRAITDLAQRAMRYYGRFNTSAR